MRVVGRGCVSVQEVSMADFDSPEVVIKKVKIRDSFAGDALKDNFGARFSGWFPDELVVVVSHGCFEVAHTGYVTVQREGDLFLLQRKILSCCELRTMSKLRTTTTQFMNTTRGLHTTNVAFNILRNVPGWWNWFVR